MSYAVASFAIWLSKTILAMCSNAKKPSSFGKLRAEIPIEVGTVISWGASQAALRYLTSATASAGANSGKYWEIIADNLSKAGWSWGCVSAIDSRGRTIWIADALGGPAQRSRLRCCSGLHKYSPLNAQAGINRRHEHKHLLHNRSNRRYRDCPQSPRGVLGVGLAGGLAGDRPGLLTRIRTTESVSLRGRMKS
jgi:hypothetical protein